MSQTRTVTLPYTRLQRDAGKTEKQPQWCKFSYLKVCIIISCLRKINISSKGAKLALNNNNGITPLDLIFNNVQDPGSFLEKFFIKNTVNEAAHTINDTRSFCFKYNILNPNSGRKRGAGKVNLKKVHWKIVHLSYVQESNDVLVNLIKNIKSKRFESEKLLAQPLLQSFIMYKWEKINWMFNIQFLLTFLFVFVFSLFTTMKCGQESQSIIETIYFVPFLVPFLVEILVFEAFLIYNIQFHYNYFQNIFKIAVFVLGKALRQHFNA